MSVGCSTDKMVWKFYQQCWWPVKKSLHVCWSSTSKSTARCQLFEDNFVKWRFASVWKIQSIVHLKK